MTSGRGWLQVAKSASITGVLGRVEEFSSAGSRGTAEPGRSDRLRRPLHRPVIVAARVRRDRHWTKRAHRLVQPAEPTGPMYYHWNGLRRVADAVDGRHQPTDGHHRSAV